MSETPTEQPKIVLAQCTNAKRDGRHAAKDLYDRSTYFVKQRQFARAVGDAWFVLSAEHGLLGPDDRVDSYDTHISDVDAEEWAADVVCKLAAVLPQDATVKILGGKKYADPLVPELEALGFEIHEPLRGQRIGERMATLDRLRESDAHATVSEVAP